MIAADSSSLVAFFNGESGHDVDLIRQSLSMESLVLPPVVLTELLSDVKASKHLRQSLTLLPMLHVADGFWERAGTMRAKLLAMNLNARLADTLIAQSCVDHSVSLITRDTDFRHFAKHFGLKLA